MCGRMALLLVAEHATRAETIVVRLGGVVDCGPL